MLCISSILGYHISMRNFDELGYLISWFTGLTWTLGWRVQVDSEPTDLQIWVVLFVTGIIVGVILSHLLVVRFQTAKIRYSAQKEVEKAKLAERERVRAIYDLISTMTSTLNYSHVLDAALDLGGKILSSSDSPIERICSVVLLFHATENGKTELRVGSARRFTPSDVRIILPGAEGVLYEVISSGEPVLCNEIDQDPELKRFVALRACKVAYLLPLRTGLEAYGVLLFAHPDPEFFTQMKRETLDVAARQAVIAIQNARLYSDLEQEKERMMDIQEEARKKLSRDLHDGPTQSVAAIAMRLNYTRRLLEKDGKAAGEEIIKIEDLARRTTKEIRHMLFTLRPLVLESQGLLAALQAMAEKMRDTYDQNVIVDVESKIIPELEMGKQTILFYIAEEAINNARKYAQAAHIWVRLKDIGSQIALLDIQDDGVGFNIGAVDATYDHRGSLGLVNMRERAELVNGVLKIESAEGKGTRIRVLIPMSEAAADRIRRGG
jgi:signal transduction histidine kinase